MISRFLRCKALGEVFKVLSGLFQGVQILLNPTFPTFWGFVLVLSYFLGFVLLILLFGIFPTFVLLFGIFSYFSSG